MPDVDVFLIPAVIVCVVWITVGAEEMLRWLTSRHPLNARPVLTGALAGGLLMAVPTYEVPRNLPAADASDDSTASTLRIMLGELAHGPAVVASYDCHAINYYLIGSVNLR